MIRRPVPHRAAAAAMRSLLTLILCAVLALALASSAFAREVPEPVRLPASLATADGLPRSAQLALAGKGTVRLKGRLVIYGELATPSDVVVRGARGIRIKIDGRKVRQRRGVARIRGASGRLYIYGRALMVTISSRDMSMSMAGVGRARLLGTGRFSLNGSEELEWGRRWIQVEPGATPPKVSTPNRRRERVRPAPASTARR